MRPGADPSRFRKLRLELEVDQWTSPPPLRAVRNRVTVAVAVVTQSAVPWGLVFLGCYQISIDLSRSMESYHATGAVRQLREKEAHVTIGIDDTSASAALDDNKRFRSRSVLDTRR